MWKYNHRIEINFQRKSCFLSCYVLPGIWVRGIFKGPFDPNIESYDRIHLDFLRDHSFKTSEPQSNEWHSNHDVLSKVCSHFTLKTSQYTSHNSSVRSRYIFEFGVSTISYCIVAVLFIKKLKYDTYITILLKTSQQHVLATASSLCQTPYNYITGHVDERGVMLFDR